MPSHVCVISSWKSPWFQAWSRVWLKQLGIAVHAGAFPCLLPWGLEIAASHLKLEPADGAVITEIVARLRRVVASKNNRQRAFVSIYRLRIIDPPAEEV